MKSKLTMDFKKKLLVFNFSIAILMIGTLSAIVIYIVLTSAKEEILDDIKTVREIKVKQIKQYFESKAADLLVTKDSPESQEGFLEFHEAFQELVTKHGADGARAYIRDLYINKNPNPPGKKDSFYNANDGSSYSKYHALYQKFYHSMANKRGLYDIYLIDRNGDVFFNVSKDDDFGTNFLTGPYKDTNNGRLVRSILEGRESEQVSFIDVDFYPPARNEPNGFLGCPIVINGKIEGALVFQYSTAELSAAIQKKAFAERKEFSFIAGVDHLLRNNLASANNEQFILKKKVDSEAVKKALNGETGVLIETSLLGTKVYSAYAPLEIGKNKFALISSMDYDEAMSEFQSIRMNLIIASLTLLLIQGITTYFMSNSIAKPVMGSVNLLSTSVREISSTIEQHEKTSSMQSAAINETATTINNINSSSKHSAEESKIVTDLAREAQVNSDKGYGDVIRMIQSIDDLKIRVSTIADQIMKLSEKNNQIGNIINLVSDLANETNMLALNAAVEAARAGENGKGFAVVAVEIRKLADESKKSAEKIRAIIDEIKKATDSTVMATEEGTKKAEQSAVIGKNVSEFFSIINDSVKGVFVSIEKISLNLRQQSVSLNEISQAMTSINRGAQETALGISQTKQGVIQINKATHSLKELVYGEDK